MRARSATLQTSMTAHRSSLRLAVLGDSIGYGIGAAAHADTLGARLVRLLREQGVDATADVAAVPGARSAGLDAQVRRTVGDPPDVAVVVIGANDVTHLVGPETAASHLRSAVRALREAGGEVVVAPAPDLSVVPHVPVAMRETVRRASDQLRRAQSEVTVAEGGRVADGHAETSRAFAADASLFAADRFHPSSKGYAVIAGALAPAVLAAVAARRTSATS
jgi:lysophospholipase L1-like esterase